MKNVFTLFLSLLFLFSSCNTEKKKEKQEIPIIQLNLEKDPLQSDLNAFLAKLDIQLMPLETSEESFFDGESNLFIGNNDLFVLDQSQDMIFRYDKQGKLINKINRKGEGPEEYVRMIGTYISNDKIYILDFKKLQIYNFDGEFLQSIPLKNSGRQLVVMSDQTIGVTGRLQEEYQLTRYNQNGQVLEEYFPRTSSIMADFPLSRPTNHSAKPYKDGMYFTNYFDNSIYFLKDTVSILATLDFGTFNIPSDMFTGAAEEKLRLFDEIRPKTVMAINRLTVTDNWIIFIPEILFNPMTVYYDRINHTFITNKGFREPYGTLLGKYAAPHNYNAQQDVFYRLVNSQDLKDMIEKLAESEPDYKTKYPFLANIDPAQINDNTNDFILLMKIKE